MIIRVEHITKIYDTQKAVDAVSFELKEGEILGLLGPNGAGKSSILKMITGILTPTSGTIYFNNHPITKNLREFQKQIGYLPEDNPLYYDMYVIDYLRFIATIHGIPKSLISSRITEMIDFCGLAPEKHKQIGQLSKGYKQRVGLAQALIHNPDFLILDEPTTGLDPNQIVEIRNLIKKLGKQKTVIFSSHILQEVEAICDRILILNNGKLVADDTPAFLRNQTLQQEILSIVIETDDSASVLNELNSVDSIDRVIQKEELHAFEVYSKLGTSSKKSIYDLCVKHNWFLSEMRILENTLEDVFFHITNKNNA